MEDLRTALAMAKQTRTCPPLRILRDPAHREAVDRHRAICPACGGGREEELEPWAELAAGLGGVVTGDVVSMDPEPAPGQIRFIRAEFGRWRGEFYYTPPAVLLLETIDGLAGAFRAAQIHFDPQLAAPGDLVLDHERTGAGDLMVECWNTYPVMSERLGPSIGELSPEALAAARKLVCDPDAVPPWAVRSLPMGGHDARIYFREIEVEVQYLFAAEAAADLLARLEGRAVRETKAEVIDFLRRRFGEHREPPGLERPEEILAAFEHPQEEMVMAAAGPSVKRRISVTRVELEKGRVKDIKPSMARIVDEGQTETGRYVTGEIADPLVPGEQIWLFCLLFRPGKPAEAAERIDWDPESRRFVADFDVPFDGPAEIRIALFVSHTSPEG